jgi:hypothetical protein
MNYKKQAEKLEKFLEEEFRAKSPLTVLSDNSLAYKRFKIKKNNLGLWDLKHITGDVIDNFRLKATAALAAKSYHYCQFHIYNRVKNLDTGYWINSVDSLVFKQRYESTNDIDKRDLYLARWEVTHHRSKQYQQEIASMFTNSF